MESDSAPLTMPVRPSATDLRQGASVTKPPGPRKNASKTVRLEDQPLPDREASFHTPRAGDWLLLAVLVVALLAIGARVWSQLGWGDQIGRAIFFGLLLLAIYWAALIYTFKLSLAARVGPQGLAIVRGPWRVELRWSEITRLMERPQAVGGRRYRWVVALARDGRRIQVREDALLDYERFRREVYERYRMWRDHGGTWGATGGGPFVARESVAEGARWWAFIGLMIALPGLYLALLLPIAQVVGYALLALAILCLVMVARVFLLRRAYALDGRMIEARGLLERIQLARRDVSKVERTRHPASGAILAVVAAGRLALRLAARGDSGIRGFAWSPRVPEYLTLRGGGRHARIRLHHLAQPEELLAWVEFYTGLRRAGASHPLESVPAESRRATPAPVAAAFAHDMDEREPDLSGVSGPLDPWGGARHGKLADEPVEATPELPRSPVPEPVLEPVFRGAPLGANFHEPDGLDLPPGAGDGAGESDEAWLRETGALFSMSGGAPTRPTVAPTPEAPRAADPVADAPTVATPAAPATPRARQFVPPPVTPRAPRRTLASAPQHTPPGAPQQTPPGAPRHTPPGPPQRTPPTPPNAAPRSIPFAPRHTPQHPESPFAPYNPDMQEGASMEAPEMVVEVAPAAPVESPPVAPTPQESVPARQPERSDLHASDADDEDIEDGDELDEPAPWRSADWQPPILPRFGPQSAQPAEDGAPRNDGGQTNY